MPKSIISYGESRDFLSKIMSLLLLTTLGVLTSVTFADEKALLFQLEDLKDPGSLAVKLQDTRAPLSQLVAKQLAAETQRLLREYDGIRSSSPALQNALLEDLNRLLQGPVLYEAQQLANIDLSDQTQELLQSREATIRLNRLLLSDVYLHELAPPLERPSPPAAKGIESCRAQLREIQFALENYRAEVDGNPPWLSDLSPKYLAKKGLCCPADPTAGVPGVLTEGASDPTLPCSYLYEFRPDQKGTQEFLLRIEGDMLPIVRCQHHLLNLSVSGKLYRTGPQRKIYNQTAGAVKTFRIQSEPPADLPEEVRKQIAEQLNKGGHQHQVKTSIVQINPGDDFHAKLKEQLGEAFLESPEGKALLKQLKPAAPVSIDPEDLALLVGKPIPAITLTDLSGAPVTLETRPGTFVLVNLFSTDSTACGPKLKQQEKLLETYHAAQLQAIGISTGGSAKGLEAFREKHQLSMPLYLDTNNQLQSFLKIESLLNRDRDESYPGLVTLLLTPELRVADLFIDVDPETLSKKLKNFMR